jgi:hypothetical protein
MINVILIDKFPETCYNKGGLLPYEEGKMLNDSLYMMELERKQMRQRELREAERGKWIRLARNSQMNSGRLSLPELFRRLMDRQAKPVLVPMRVQRPEILRQRRPQQQCC